ncbi:MAG TPA: RIO1 family regulatory kinase/ATPase [Actinomycetes bacterium]|nr:RIO1 family regulatory kinase/ATPase [Actinomycetes bacterium]
MSTSRPQRVSRAGQRRRPSGEAPPLPRTLNRSGRIWLIAGAAVLLLWAGVVSNQRTAVWVLEADHAVVEWIAGLRTAVLTDVMQTVHALGSRWTIRALFWATVIALVLLRRFRHLFVFLGATLAVTAFTGFLAYAFAWPRPLGVEIIGAWSGYANPSRPVAALAAILIGMLYSMAPAGRLRRVGKPVIAGLVTALALSLMYLAVNSPSDVIIAAVVGVTIPLVAFRMITPNEVFPVTYHPGSSAHLDVGGRRGQAIHRALEDQLGLQVAAIKPFGLSGSAGSTPLRITVKGDPETWLFAKLYAGSHLRSDRWYKLGRTLLYGRLEDEKPFNTVRRLVQQEDYALRLMYGAGVRSPEPFGIVEITPEREYLVVTEFFTDAREIGDLEQVDDGIIDDGLRIIRRLWDAGLAHRDIKPANLLVRDGKLYLIDVFFAEIHPSPWRQAVDLANMMLVLATRSSPQQVYERARLQFNDDEIAEAFAATSGITMPSQLRKTMRDQGRDLHAEFLALLPEWYPPVAIQRWSLRRVGLMIGVVLLALLALAAALNSFSSAGLL